MAHKGHACVDQRPSRTPRLARAGKDRRRDDVLRARPTSKRHDTDDTDRISTFWPLYGREASSEPIGRTRCRQKKGRGEEELQPRSGRSDGGRCAKAPDRGRVPCSHRANGANETIA